MPVLLDLFCGIGGASKGYADAGFDVVGVDIDRRNQPDYPFEFIHADALTVNLDGYDAYHASAPCQAFTPLNAYNRDSHVNLVSDIRDRLQATGKPYVIENVPQARLRNPVRLCAWSFGLRLYRHRDFETNWPLLQPDHKPHVYRCMRAGYLPTSEKPFMSVHGRFGHNSHAWAKQAADYMGIDWTEYTPGICEAIPPVYTQHVGTELMSYIMKV